MPPQDIYHNTVRTALEKDGWTITIVLGFHPYHVRQHTGYAIA